MPTPQVPDDQNLSAAWAAHDPLPIASISAAPSPKLHRNAVSGITIDPGIHFDIDDAIGVVRDGLSRVLNISIADVASQLPQSDAVDLEARSRVASRYFGEHQDSMFPPRLTEFEYSLREGAARPAVTVSIPYTVEGAFGAPEISLTTVTSTAQLTYRSASDRLRYRDGPSAGELAELAHVAPLLFQQRTSAPELLQKFEISGVLLGEDGVPRKVARSSFTTYFIVQECMIAANRMIADYFVRHGAHALFRNQVAMSQLEPQLFRDNPTLSKFVRSFSAQQLRIGSRAYYSIDAEGHFHLGLPAYTHATSPIRRYADVVNQRILSALIRAEPPPYGIDELKSIALQISRPSDNHRTSRKGEPPSPAAATFPSATDAIATKGQIRTLLASAAEGTSMTAEFWSEVIARIEKRSLHVGDHYRLLESKLTPSNVVDAVLQFYSGNPACTPQLIQLLGHGGLISNLNVTEECRFGASGVRHRVTAKWHDHVVHEVVSSYDHTKKSRSNAYVRLLASVLGRRQPDPPDSLPTAAPSIEAAEGATESNFETVSLPDMQEMRSAYRKFCRQFGTGPANWLRKYCSGITSSPLILDVTGSGSDERAPYTAVWTTRLEGNELTGNALAARYSEATELAAMDLIRKLVADPIAANHELLASLDEIGPELKALQTKFKPFEFLKTVCHFLNLPAPLGSTVRMSSGDKTAWRAELRFTAPDGSEITLAHEAPYPRGLSALLSLQALDGYFRAQLDQSQGEWIENEKTRR